MSIAAIKNIWLRRVILVVLTPIILFVCIVLGAANGIWEYGWELWEVQKAAWNGRD